MAKPPGKSDKPAPKKENVKLIAENKKARFDYSLEDTFEAGMVLTGSEVKSLRAGSVNLKDSYVAIIRGEAYLQNAHISEYKASSYNNHLPERLRKLLLNAHELNQIEEYLTEKGLSCVPTKIYFKNGRVKIEIAIAKGKKVGDKRQSLKEKDAKREMAQAKAKR